MKTLLLNSILISLLSLTCKASSGDSIVVPFGTDVSIDGIISATEWSDADTIQIPGIGGIVYFKHTATHLLVAFTDDKYYFGSTGIYFDKLHDQDFSPQSDDIWIHGSMGPFEWYGNGVNWQSATPSNWIYSSNTANEYRIELTKLDVSLDKENVLGVLFSFLDWSTSSAEITWPAGGNLNLKVPHSWATMIIEAHIASLQEKNKRMKAAFYQAHGQIYIPDADQYQSIKLYDIHGKAISYSLHANQLNTNHLPSGVYILALKDANRLRITEKILVY